MKKILPLLLLTIAAMTSVSAEEAGWRKAAREFMADQGFAPIEFKGEIPAFSDYERERWAWLQRILLPPFEKHLEKWPAQAEAARSFVKQGLMLKAGNPDADPKRPFKVLAQEGEDLAKAGVDDPLVLWLAAWATWEHNEAYDKTWAHLVKAMRPKMLNDYPSMLAVYIQDIAKETQRNTESKEVAARNAQERYKLVMKSTLDPAVYGPEDDRLLFHDLVYVLNRENLKERPEELKQLCETPHFTPWLREMLQGNLQNQIAWSHRGEGWANTVSPENWQKFEEYQLKARPHYLKAWELRPDRAAAAAAMIEIVKCGNGRPQDLEREWFDRAAGAEPRHYAAFSAYLWALRPRWGGSLDEMKAFYCACALTGRFDSTITSIMSRTLEYLEEDSSDIHALLSQPPMQETVLHVYRTWQHPSQMGDLGVMAWKAGDYETAYETLQKVPFPLPSRSLRLLHHAISEIDVRGQSAIFAVGMKQEWEAAEESYTSHKPGAALQNYQDIASRFQDTPPTMLLERIAACKFEAAFATGKWVPIKAAPDLNEWHKGTGSWAGQEDGTLVNTGTNARAYISLNGHTGSNFELMGEYEVLGMGDTAQGLGIILGYHRKEMSEEWISCSQWSSEALAVASMLRKTYQTSAPHITPPANGRVWKFHIVCRNSAVTYRLNHRDIVVDHRVAGRDGEEFVMPEDSTIGFGHHFLNAKSHTHIRNLRIRRLEPPVPPEARIPVKLHALRDSFEAECERTVADLNAMALLEAETQAAELERAHKDQEAGKIRVFASQLKSSEAARLSAVPSSVTGETTLAAMLRGYQSSLNARLRSARAAWKEDALRLRETTQDPKEAAEVMHYISSSLEEAQEEEPLAAANRFKWQALSGDWQRTSEVLTGSGDSRLTYEFNRRPPFQIDFDINVLEGNRPHLYLGNVKFAGEGDKNTFGLYPQPKGEKLFEYEPGKPRHITLKATAEKTELLIDGVHVCDGPKIKGEINVLQFRGGDKVSKGKTEFHKIRISPLP
ncbi:hypothetical protein [Prosthecobacter sp.]|uniref:hypothetical protein n=1 Tax=Prosthecobacter sp. TaxID=1965333 RepID=UPI003783AA1F